MTPAQFAALVALAGRQLDEAAVALFFKPDGVDLDGLAALLSVGRIERGQVTRAVFSAWCASTGMRAAIEDHAANLASPLRSIALSLRDVLVGGAKDLDFSWPENVQMLDAWIAAGALSRGHADALLALSEHAAPVDRLKVESAIFKDAF